MNIQPTNCINTPCFKAGMTNKAITKTMPRGMNAIKKSADCLSEHIPLRITNSADERAIKDRGITYCSLIGEQINIGAGYNNGYFTFRISPNVNSDNIKSYLAYLLNYKNSLGGLQNYMDMVKDLKRQDLIRKGLRIHTYEVNTNIPEHLKVRALPALKKTLGYKVNEDELFYIENNAYFYNKINKTAYEVSLDIKANTGLVTPVTKCEFITDANNNTIGYKRVSWDIYKCDNTENLYIEQQAPGKTLNTIAQFSNNKEMAEAFRFGNSSPKYTTKKSLPNIIRILSPKINKDLAEDSFVFVRYYDRDNNIQSRICYYDPSIGTSFVFNTDGKFMHKIEYIRNSEGGIITYNQL